MAADASSTGIGAVLLQVQGDGSRRPICYASRSLTDTEKRYAVIEKEALASTWACDRFSEYVFGMPFTLETDHKPLVPLLTTKDLVTMPIRIQRFKMRLMRYNPDVRFVSGKSQVTVDALSRAPHDEADERDRTFIAEVTSHTEAMIDLLPASEHRLSEIKACQRSDEECSKVMEYCQSGWPSYPPHSLLLCQYWDHRGHLTVVDGLLIYDDYPQANGEAERAVKTAKQFLSKNNNPYLGLLTYRSTPLQNGLSPSELLMGRRLRTRLPVLPSTLMPGIGIKDLEQVMAKEERLRGKQERNFNESHRARDLPPLEPGDSVWVRDKDREGQVLCRTPNPRSYLIETSQGTLRRNRASLVPTNMKPPSRVADFPALTSPRSPVAEQPAADMGSAPSSSPPHALSTAGERHTRSGRTVRTPKRLDL